jgi:hypothetical protein
MSSSTWNQSEPSGQSTPSCDHGTTKANEANHFSILKLTPEDGTEAEGHDGQSIAVSNPIYAPAPDV